MECNDLFFDKKKIKISTIFLVSLIVSLLMSAAWITYAIQKEEREQRRLSQFYSQNISQKISLFFQSLAQNLSPIYTMLVLQKGGTENFASIADHVLRSNAEIININLAKDGIVSDVFPYESNSVAVGHDLLQAENRKQEAILARVSRKITLAGPFNLVQGGTGIAFR